MRNILIFGMTENPGGVESFLMTYIRKMDHTKFRFGFLCNSYEKVAYEDELLALGCEMYHISARSKDYKRYKKEMNAFFQEHASQYDIIWVNVCSLANIDYLIYAKKYGIKRRVIHSHNSMNMDSKLRGILHKFNKMRIARIATDFWACSRDAGEWFYSSKIINGETYKEIKNAIDISAYKYNDSVRTKYRKDLNVEDKFVVGNVGRLQFQKNQLFLLDIFACIAEKRSDAVLWLVGQGEDEEKLREKIHRLQLENNVKMLGVRDDVPNLLQAMDVFVFPSVFEGLGIALLEAQAAGLVCFASKDVIPEEVKVIQELEFVSLDETPEKWASKVLNASYNVNRVDLFNSVAESGYNIDTEVNRLEKLLEV